jgi:NitT/TauT family transport system substrate-binding protein
MLSRVGLLALTVWAFCLVAPPSRAEIHVATQYGFGFLPMMVIEHEHLFGRRLAASGVTETIGWSTLGGGATMNDALLSGEVDIASGGVAPFILIWSRTQANHDVRAISALSTMPLWFVTRDPDVHALDELTDRDKIALTAPNVSVHAVLLRIAAAKRFGMQDYTHYDHLTVAMAQPDSTAALLSGAINNHFSAPPFEYLETRHAGVRAITSASEILGGPASFIVTWTTARFRQDRPAAYAAWLAATQDAMALINNDLEKAASIYLEMSHDTTSREELLLMLRQKGTQFTMVPQKMMTYASYMADFGMIRTRPESWKDLFFPEIQGQPGD